MRLIYTTGGPRQMEFAVVSGQHAIPTGARVVAVCDGERTVRRLDEETFRAMTDEDYYTLDGLIADTQQAEASRPRDGARERRAGTFRGIISRALGL